MSMVTSEKEMTIDCKSDSHVCTVCNKKLMVKAWWPAVVITLVMLLPYLIVWGIDKFIPKEMDPPYCYQEERKGETIKRIFVVCDF